MPISLIIVHIDKKKNLLGKIIGGGTCPLCPPGSYAHAGCVIEHILWCMYVTPLPYLSSKYRDVSHSTESDPFRFLFHVVQGTRINVLITKSYKKSTILKINQHQFPTECQAKIYGGNDTEWLAKLMTCYRLLYTPERPSSLLWYCW